MGKKKYIETPEKLFELFEMYQADTKDNPRIKKVTGNKDFVIHQEKLERPLTMEGFEVFCAKRGNTIDHYFRNTDNSYDDYRPICYLIKQIIRQDQIEGGMVGQYQHSITQRLNGLVDKTEQKIVKVGKDLEDETYE